MTGRERTKISYVYFVMSVLVILIHSVNNDTKFELFFSENGIGQFAVPLFFVISGFLFFRTVDSIEDVKRKLKKHINTLLVPYMLWNLIYYAIHLLMKPGEGIGYRELYEAVFNYKYNPAFWFMYQLIFLNILSLVFFYALKNYKTAILFIVLISSIILLESDLPYVNEDAIIYFFSGALFSKLYNDNKVSFISKKHAPIFLILSIALLLLNRVLYNAIYINLIFRPVFTLSIVFVRLSFALFLFYLLDLFFKYEKVYPFMEHTFFLYAIHFMIVKAMIIFMRFICFKFLPGIVLIPIEIGVFVLSPIVCIVVNYYLPRFMIRKFSDVYYILSGNR